MELTSKSTAFILGATSRGKSRTGPLPRKRGAISNGRPYRDLTDLPAGGFECNRPGYVNDYVNDLVSVSCFALLLKACHATHPLLVHSLDY